MLYQLYEAQRSLMEPFSDLAKVASKVYSNPMSTFGQTPFSQRASAGFDLLHRLLRDYEKPEFGIRTVDVNGVGVAIDERIEMARPFCELRRFKRFSDDPATLDALKVQPAVLIVAPLSGHHSTLLRDTVRTMLRDHKVRKESECLRPGCWSFTRSTSVLSCSMPRSGETPLQGSSR